MQQIFGVVLQLSLLTVAFGQDGRVSFITEALRRATKCDDLYRNDCIFFHEAIDKCPVICEKRIREGNPNRGGNSNLRPGGRGSGRTGGTGGGGCFSADSTVTTNFGPMTMKDLLMNKNIKALSVDTDNRLQFSTVYSWLHANASTETPFFVITTESGHTLTITEAHLIYETDCRGKKRTVFAKKLKINRCVYVNDNGALKESKIVDIKLEMKMGIFAPVTEMGNIVVDGVLASCFTNFENEFLLKFVYSSLYAIRMSFSAILPEWLMDSFFDNTFNSAVDVSQAFLTFVDLTKPFLK